MNVRTYTHLVGQIKKKSMNLQKHGLYEKNLKHQGGNSFKHCEITYIL